MVYLGLSVQGSNDNFPYHDTETGPGVPVRSDAEIDRQRREEMARRAADFRWLEEGFDYAERVHAKGVMIIWQADPNFNNEQHQTNPHEFDAYDGYINELRRLAEAFSGQVALVHIRRAQHALGESANRRSRPERIPFRAADRSGQRAIVRCWVAPVAGWAVAHPAAPRA